MNRIIGVLWAKHKDGQEYYSGILRDLHGDINIAVFPNNRKSSDNQPDFNIVVSWDWEKKHEQVIQEAEPKKNGKKKAKVEGGENDKDLPF